MELTCNRPYAFYFLLLLIPTIVVYIVQYRKIISLKKHSFYEEHLRRFPLMLTARAFFWTLAYTMLVFAYSGISWGTYLEGVQKNGSAVSFVFDISYSMNARDSIGKLSRLEAAGKYASTLLSHIPQSSISVVLAKGDGITVVPLTEDRAAVESLLDTLSPSLMSATGTSLGKGIRAALKSFPENSGAANAIWLFTDGDETDGLLEGSLGECMKKGIPVCIVGFGSEKESTVTAGDGHTLVSTALRSEKMRKMCADVMARNASQVQDIFVTYVDSFEAGSALPLLTFISNASNNSDCSYITYQMKPVERYQLFLILAIVFFSLGFVIVEVDTKRIAEKVHIKLAASIVCPLLFLSCSSDFLAGKNILYGTWNCYQRKYNSAVALFLQTSLNAAQSEDVLLEQYALYDLATVYLMQNENEAASFRFLRLSTDSPENIQFCSFYNLGIIAYRGGKYEEAAHYFKNALKIDGSNVNAKINFELSSQKIEKNVKAQGSGILEVAENEQFSAMEEAIFQIIRQQDREQWKNSESEEYSSSGMDY
ncbi:MAG: VWA domain-containing protein [Treponema sp.]|nr:VWA domain-containing protein [Treponema sp.]